VRTDGPHTIAELERQMAYLRTTRGTGQHAQLIGGEVTLLGPEDHARALEVMERHGRKPMSMTHGDFDYDYLHDLAIAPDGSRRFRRLRVAGHFDSLMLGRRGVPRPRSEAELDAHRRRFVAMFERLRAQHGVGFDLAHNMTVTPRNLGEVASVVRSCAGMRFGMMSFQPAAYVGNPRRWKEDFRAVTIDDVWAEIERGVGTRLPWAHLQMGDARCNRSAYGILAGGRWTPILDDRDERDLRVRDRFLDAFGGMDFERAPAALVAAVARVVARHPAVVPAAAGWAARFVRRSGARRLLTGRPRALTFVVHAFMDAEVVKPAWEGRTRWRTPTRTASSRRACSTRCSTPRRTWSCGACCHCGRERPLAPCPYASPCVRTARIASRDRFASLGHEQRQDESDERHERPQARGGAQKLLALSLRAVTARCARADPPRPRAHPKRAQHDAETGAVEEVADERWEPLAEVGGGPLGPLAEQPREQREVADEPPGDAVADAPGQRGGAVDDLATEEHGEARADEDGDEQVYREPGNG
jgi:hypothetical protein